MALELLRRGYVNSDISRHKIQRLFPRAGLDSPKGVTEPEACVNPIIVIA